jgi:hypothetical protein
VAPSCTFLNGVMQILDLFNLPASAAHAGNGNSAAVSTCVHKPASVQVTHLQAELADAHVQHERSAAAADRALAEERAKLQRLVQKRADDLDSHSAHQHEELLAAVQKSEGLKRAVAESEAAMLRQVSFMFSSIRNVVTLVYSADPPTHVFAGVLG